MNKFILGILLTSVTFFTGYDPAVADTGDVIVTATIQQVVAVDVTGNSNSFEVTPGSAVTNQDIATITIESNSSSGYDVTLTGTHATSVLTNTAEDASMAYTVKYNDGTATGVTTTATNVESSTGMTSGEETRSLTLSIDASETVGKAAEAFTDTITVEIAAK